MITNIAIYMLFVVIITLAIMLAWDLIKYLIRLTLILIVMLTPSILFGLIFVAIGGWNIGIIAGLIFFMILILFQFNKENNIYNITRTRGQSYTSSNPNFSYDYPLSKRDVLQQFSQNITGKSYIYNDYPPSENELLRDIRGKLKGTTTFEPEHNMSLLRDISVSLGNQYGHSDYPPSENAYLRDIRNKLLGQPNIFEYESDESLLQQIAQATSKQTQSVGPTSSGLQIDSKTQETIDWHNSPGMQDLYRSVDQGLREMRSDPNWASNYAASEAAKAFSKKK